MELIVGRIHTLSRFVSSTRWYIKVSGRTKPAFTLSSNRSMQSLSPKKSINFPRESLFSGGHSSFWSHQSIYLLNIQLRRSRFPSLESVNTSSEVWFLFSFIWEINLYSFCAAQLITSSFLQFFCTTLFLFFCHIGFVLKRYITCIEMGNSSKCYWESFREEFYVELTS